MINKGIENLISWLDINDIYSWSLSRNKDRSQNDYIFKSIDDADRATEIQRMMSILTLSSEPILYIFAKKRGSSNSGNFSEMWINTTSYIEPIAPTNAVDGVNVSDLEQRIKCAVYEERIAWERKELERERAELRARAKEYDDKETSVIGLLIDRAAPLIQKFTHTQPQQAAVAGIGTATNVSAEKITPIENDEEEVVFDENESDELFNLMAEYKSLDPDYLRVIAKIVDFARSGEEIPVMNGMIKLTYNQIKNMLL